MSDELQSAAQELSRLMFETGAKVAFAESCTAGLVAATIGQIPGVSPRLCGSAVVYQEDTKTRWLGVPPNLFDEQGGPGAVSDPVARHMVLGLLRATPEANWGAAITGHLGPNAPEPLDGLVYIATARRDNTLREVRVDAHHLPAEYAGSALSVRCERQRLAVLLVLRALSKRLQRNGH